MVDCESDSSSSELTDDTDDILLSIGGAPGRRVPVELAKGGKKEPAKLCAGWMSSVGVEGGVSYTNSPLPAAAAEDEEALMVGAIAADMLLLMLLLLVVTVRGRETHTEALRGRVLRSHRRRKWQPRVATRLSLRTIERPS